MTPISRGEANSDWLQSRNLPIKAATLLTPLPRCTSQKILAPYTVVTKGGNYQRPNMHWTWVFYALRLAILTGKSLGMDLLLEPAWSGHWVQFLALLLSLHFSVWGGFHLVRSDPSLKPSFSFQQHACEFILIFRSCDAVTVQDFQGAIMSHHLQWPLRKQNKLDICWRGAKKEDR